MKQLFKTMYHQIMLWNKQAMRFSTTVLALAFITVTLASALAAAQSDPASSPAKDQPSTPPPSATPATPAPKSTSRFRATTIPPKARNHYQMIWGVDTFNVKSVESGEMIRFSYRVLDAEKAAQLNDKHDQPALISPRANVSLSIPTLEKVGQLRQATSPEAGKVYWMVFSNKERYVKKGDRVSVVIGKFRVDNLLVE
jgi:hypothetical protein